MAVVYVFKLIEMDHTDVSSSISILHGKQINRETKKLERIYTIPAIQLQKQLTENENFFYNNVFKKMGFKRLPGGTHDVFKVKVKEPEFGVLLNQYWASWRINDANKSYSQLVKELEKLFNKVGPYMVEDGLVKFSKSPWK